MANNNEQSTFSQLLGRSLVMSIPGMLSGVGQGIAASDPRQPYRGLGVGLASGIQPMQRFAGSVIDQQMANEQYEGDTARAIKRKKAFDIADQEGADQRFDTETERMLRRRKAIKEAESGEIAGEYDAETERMLKRRKAIKEAEEAGADQQYDTETERMLRRRKRVGEVAREEQAADITANRELSRQQAAEDAARFRKMRDMTAGINIGMRGLDDQSKMFAAQFAASQILPSPAMRMSGIQGARQIFGGQ